MYRTITAVVIVILGISTLGLLVYSFDQRIEAHKQFENWMSLREEVTADNDAETDHKTLIASLFLEAWNKQDFSSLEGYTEDSIVFHMNQNVFTTRLENLKQMVASWHHSFDNFEFTIHHIVADGDMVAANMTYSGIHVKPFRGIPAKGNTIEVSEMMFFRFEGNKLAEAWEVYDEVGFLKQLKGE